jgi:hypothetical protein
MNEEQAVAFYESGVWRELSSYKRAVLQLTEERLCMPFKVFHAAVEEVLGRPVYTHELTDSARLLSEMVGTIEPPTLEEIIALIPEEKRVVFMQDDGSRLN